MDMQAAADAVIRDEYGCDFRRLFPWKGKVESPWGSAWATVKPGTRTTRHSHDEEETFIILAGKGLMSVNDETKRVVKGDVVYLPPFSEHTLLNDSTTQPLEMLCIWWGGSAQG